MSSQIRMLDSVVRALLHPEPPKKLGVKKQKKNEKKIPVWGSPAADGQPTSQSDK